MNENEQDRLLRPKLEALILARLSVVESRRSRARVSRALYTTVARQWSPAQWRERYESALGSLCEARLVEPNTLLLTSRGRARLSASLGLSAPPRAADWKEFKARYLPRLLFPEVRPKGRRPALDGRAAVLAKRLGVSQPSAVQAGVDAVIEHWLAQTLEIRGPLSLESVGAALLGRELGLRPRQTRAAVLRQSAVLLSGARNATTTAVTDALTAGWLCGERAVPGARNGGADRHGSADDGGPSDDTRRQRIASNANKNNATNGTTDVAFLVRAAAKVERAARGPRARAFGPDKVFIASVWESLAGDPEIRELGEGGFKALLVEAHRRGLVALSRADLVAAMNPSDVAASETRHRGATYHFISKGLQHE